MSIVQQVLDTYEGEQLSLAATDVFSCHRRLMNTGVEKKDKHLNIDQNFDHQMSVSK
jgi:hypothetical protein